MAKADFALAYADQTETDQQMLTEAIHSLAGSLPTMSLPETYDQQNYLRAAAN